METVSPARGIQCIPHPLENATLSYTQPRTTTYASAAAETGKRPVSIASALHSLHRASMDVEDLSDLLLDASRSNWRGITPQTSGTLHPGESRFTTPLSHASKLGGSSIHIPTREPTQREDNPLGSGNTTGMAAGLSPTFKQYQANRLHHATNQRLSSLLENIEQVANSVCGMSLAACMRQFGGTTLALRGELESSSGSGSSGLSRATTMPALGSASRSCDDFLQRSCPPSAPGGSPLEVVRTEVPPAKRSGSHHGAHYHLPLTLRMPRHDSSNSDDSLDKDGKVGDGHGATPCHLGAHRFSSCHSSDRPPLKIQKQRCITKGSRRRSLAARRPHYARRHAASIIASVARRAVRRELLGAAVLRPSPASQQEDAPQHPPEEHPPSPSPETIPCQDFPSTSPTPDSVASPHEMDREAPRRSAPVLVMAPVHFTTSSPTSPSEALPPLGHPSDVSKLIEGCLSLHSQSSMLPKDAEAISSPVGSADGGRIKHGASDFGLVPVHVHPGPVRRSSGSSDASSPTSRGVLPLASGHPPRETGSSPRGGLLPSPKSMAASLSSIRPPFFAHQLVTLLPQSHHRRAHHLQHHAQPRLQAHSPSSTASFPSVEHQQGTTSSKNRTSSHNLMGTPMHRPQSNTSGTDEEYLNEESLRYIEFPSPVSSVCDVHHHRRSSPHVVAPFGKRSQLQTVFSGDSPSPNAPLVLSIVPDPSERIPGFVMGSELTGTNTTTTTTTTTHSTILSSELPSSAATPNATLEARGASPFVLPPAAAIAVPPPPASATGSTSLVSSSAPIQTEQPPAAWVDAPPSVVVHTVAATAALSGGSSLTNVPVSILIHESSPPAPIFLGSSLAGAGENDPLHPCATSPLDDDPQVTSFHVEFNVARATVEESPATPLEGHDSPAKCDETQQLPPLNIPVFDETVTKESDEGCPTTMPSRTTVVQSLPPLDIPEDLDEETPSAHTPRSNQSSAIDAKSTERTEDEDEVSGEQYSAPPLPSVVAVKSEEDEEGAAASPNRHLGDDSPSGPRPGRRHHRMASPSWTCSASTLSGCSPKKFPGGSSWCAFQNTEESDPVILYAVGHSSSNTNSSLPRNLSQLSQRHGSLVSGRDVLSSYSQRECVSDLPSTLPISLDEAHPLGIALMPASQDVGVEANLAPVSATLIDIETGVSASTVETECGVGAASPSESHHADSFVAPGATDGVPAPLPDHSSENRSRESSTEAAPSLTTFSREDPMGMSEAPVALSPQTSHGESKVEPPVTPDDHSDEHSGEGQEHNPPISTTTVTITSTNQNHDCVVQNEAEQQEVSEDDEVDSPHSVLQLTVPKFLVANSNGSMTARSPVMGGMAVSILTSLSTLSHMDSNELHSDISLGGGAPATAPAVLTRHSWPTIDHHGSLAEGSTNPFPSVGRRRVGLPPSLADDAVRHSSSALRGSPGMFQIPASTSTIADNATTRSGGNLLAMSAPNLRGKPGSPLESRFALRRGITQRRYSPSSRMPPQVSSCDVSAAELLVGDLSPASVPHLDPEQKEESSLAQWPSIRLSSRYGEEAAASLGDVRRGLNRRHPSSHAQNRSSDYALELPLPLAPSPMSVSAVTADDSVRTTLSTRDQSSPDLLSSTKVGDTHSSPNTSSLSSLDDQGLPNNRQHSSSDLCSCDIATLAELPRRAPAEPYTYFKAIQANAMRNSSYFPM